MTGSGKFRSLKRKGFDYANVLSDLDSKKPYRKKVKSCAKFWDQEVDRDYDWLLNFLLNTDKQKKVKIFENHDENINHYENEDDYENEHEEEEEDANDEDPQYCLFLQNLVQNGRSYKLKISKDDEPLRFLHYEESENSVGYDDIDDDDDPPTYGEYANQIPQDMQIVQRDEQMLIGKEGKISTINEVSRKKKTNEPNSVIGPYLGTWDSCYLRFLKEFNPSNGKFFYEGKEVEYEKSDKQLVLAENQQVLSEKQQVLAEKQLVLPGKQPVLAEKRLSVCISFCCICYGGGKLCRLGNGSKNVIFGMGQKKEVIFLKQLVCQV